MLRLQLYFLKHKHTICLLSHKMITWQKLLWNSFYVSEIKDSAPVS